MLSPTDAPTLGEPATIGAQPASSACGEIRFEMHIGAAAGTVFALLTDADRMTTWLAPQVRADPRPGGVLRLADFDGLWIEGVYIELIPDRSVAFTWGGIDGLKLGASTVGFSLQLEATRTLLRLRHFNLARPAFELHRIGWEDWALPRLKAVAEGQKSHGTYLGAIADWRERCSCDAAHLR